MLVKVQDRQFGCISCPKAGGCVEAFVVAKKVMNAMKDEFDQHRTIPTKQAFADKRDNLLAKCSQRF